MPRQQRVQSVTILEVERVAHRLAQTFMEWGEPIPEFKTRFTARLESCLATPFQKFAGRSLYRGLIGKGAALFYFMIKNHPFQNGNKRVAVMTLLYFLQVNRWWLSTTEDDLYSFATAVARSDPRDKEAVLSTIRGFIRKHLTRR